MTSRSIVVPDGVTLNVKSRVVDVSGPRGKLTKSFTHLDVDMYLVTSEEKQTVLKVRKPSPATPGIYRDSCQSNQTASRDVVVVGGD